MFEVKESISHWLPVRIFDSTGAPVTGVVFGGVTASVMKADHTVANFTVLVTDWFEATTGGFAGSGTYAIQVPGSVLDQTGPLEYAVATSGNKTHIGAVKVVANEEVDTFTRLGAPVGASTSADIAAVQTNLVRALGLLHENSVLDLTTFNVNNDLTGGRLRLYNSKANADAAQAASPGVYDTGKIAEYNILATYAAGNLQTYEVARTA